MLFLKSRKEVKIKKKITICNLVASNQQVFRTILKRRDAILQNYEIFLNYLYLIKITKTMNAPISFKTTSQVYYYKALEIFNLFYR